MIIKFAVRVEGAVKDPKGNEVPFKHIADSEFIASEVRNGLEDGELHILGEQFKALVNDTYLKGRMNKLGELADESGNDIQGGGGPAEGNEKGGDAKPPEGAAAPNAGGIAAS